MIVPRERLAGGLGEHGRVAGDAWRGRRSPRGWCRGRGSETPSRSSVLEHALHLADAELVRDDLLDGGRVALLERVEQLARLLAREQLVGVAADRLGEVRDDDGLGVDDRVAERLGLGAGALVDPDRGQAERGLDRSGCRRGRAARRRGPSRGGGRGRSRPRATSAPRTLIAYSCESSMMSSWMRTGAITMPELGGDLAADDADAREQRAAGALVDERHQAEADRELERVDRRARRSRSVAGGARAASRARRRLLLGAASLGVARPSTARPSRRARRRRCRNGSLGRPGTSARRQIDAAGDHRRARLARGSGP